MSSRRGPKREPKLQFVASDWIHQAEFKPAEGALDLRQPTVVGKIQIQKRWYDLFLQLAGPIPLVWVESRLTKQPAWITDKGKKKIDQLLHNSKEQQP